MNIIIKKKSKREEVRGGQKDKTVKEKITKLTFKNQSKKKKIYKKGVFIFLNKNDLKSYEYKQ